MRSAGEWCSLRSEVQLHFTPHCHSLPSLLSCHPCPLHRHPCIPSKGRHGLADPSRVCYLSQSPVQGVDHWEVASDHGRFLGTCLATAYFFHTPCVFPPRRHMYVQSYLSESSLRPTVFVFTCFSWRWLPCFRCQPGANPVSLAIVNLP